MCILSKCFGFCLPCNGFAACSPLARAFGKESSKTACTSVRVIVPLTAILQISDAVLSLKLEAFLQSKFTPSKLTWEGGRPKTQLMDIVSGLSLYVEKALDFHSSGAIAQEDIKQHYDTIHCVRIFRWLVENGCEISLAAACLRHQLLPPIVLSVRGATSTIRNRCLGGLTGSRVAGQLGRVPVQATIQSILPSLTKLAWSQQDVTLVVTSYVDNVWFLAPNAYKATRMADLFAVHLQRYWSQTIKPTSKQVMSVFGATDESTIDDSWDVVFSMPVLGHLISANGSIEEDFQFTIRKMWKTFWSNAGLLSARRLPLDHKLKLIQRATLPIADQHMVRWPFTDHRAKQVDRVQRKMLLICNRCAPMPTEDSETFFKRRHREAATLQRRAGRWSHRWATQVVKWHSHIRRDPNFSWPSQLLKVRPPAELQARRWLWNRPRTRVLPGFTNARWTECVEKALEVHGKSGAQ